MAKKNVSLIEKDGFAHERHETAIDKGKTPIGFVEVPAPKTFEDLQTMVENGLDTEATICKMYIKAKTVDLQAAARRAKTGGKMPKYDFARIYAELSDDDKRNPWERVVQMINEIYKETA